MERILAGHSCVYPPQVYIELDRGEHALVNQHALTATWLSQIEISAEADRLIPEFKRDLGGAGDKNLGEAQCLAVSKAVESSIYIDDGDAGDIGDAENLDVWTTVDILQDGIDRGIATKEEAADAVDKLIDTGYKLFYTSGASFLRSLG
jgi:predicted nucleic acid-binding protein